MHPQANETYQGKAQPTAPTQPRPVFTIPQFAERNRAFTVPSLRNLVFKADPRHSTRGEIPGNGLIEAGAIIRIGRKVLIDEDAFFAWVDAQKGTPTPGSRG